MYHSQSIPSPFPAQFLYVYDLLRPTALKNNCCARSNGSLILFAH